MDPYNLPTRLSRHPISAKVKGKEALPDPPTLLLTRVKGYKGEGLRVAGMKFSTPQPAEDRGAKDSFVWRRPESSKKRREYQ
jgi:hypothetical protein